MAEKRTFHVIRQKPGEFSRLAFGGRQGCSWRFARTSDIAHGIGVQAHIAVQYGL
jgi:hypothetical protein